MSTTSGSTPKFLQITGSQVSFQLLLETSEEASRGRGNKSGTEGCIGVLYMSLGAVKELNT